MLEAESNPWRYFGTIGNQTRDLSVCSAVPKVSSRLS